MKSVQPIATSLVLSIAASVLASWLLRHTVFLAQGGEGEPTGGNVVSPVVVVPIVFVGNTLGTQVTVPRRGLARKFGGRRRQRR
jgi:hypothetical protein